jgi:UDPglucose 6-dehydrogenase
MRVSIVGLGKVGLSFASCLAAAGHSVVGADMDAELVASINRRELHTPEPGIAERLARAPSGAMTATTDVACAVLETAVTFVIVPTPSNALGGFSLRHVLAACDAIGGALRRKADHHTVAIVSTLLPGSSDRMIIPRLEAASGRSCGDGLGYCYNPSFIALGEVVEGIEQPDYLLIGEADARAGDVVLSIHQSMVTARSPVARMTPIEAEITKIASNAHETMRVSFANMLLSVCSEVPGADVDRVTGALAHRMGRRFFKGAVPYGGPCWPRDNQALALFIDAVRAMSRLPRAVDAFNTEHGRYVVGKILALSRPGQRVGVLGLAYKPGTPVIDSSFGVELARSLAREGRLVAGWDPLAPDEVVRAALGSEIDLRSTAEECMAQSSVAVITIPLSELASIDWRSAGHVTMVDCWRCLPVETAGCFRNYVPLGRGPRRDVAAWLDEIAGDGFAQLVS